VTFAISSSYAFTLNATRTSGRKPPLEMESAIKLEMVYLARTARNDSNDIHKEGTEHDGGKGKQRCRQRITSTEALGRKGELSSEIPFSNGRAGNADNNMAGNETKK
jgi:hypothetical protein